MTNYTTKKDFICDIMPPARPRAAEKEEVVATTYHYTPSSSPVQTTVPVYSKAEMRDYRRHELKAKLSNMREILREWRLQ